MTFPTGLDFRKYSDEELTAMLVEAAEASKHARKRGRVMGIVAAHRVKQMRTLLMYEELATWRRENGFDREMEGEESCFTGHRSLPPTPQEYYASLWCEVNGLKDAISMPLQLLKLFNAIEQDTLSDEEYATLKRCMEKRVRETAQVTAVTRDNTVQPCSLCSPNPDRPSGVLCNLENEGTMSQELEELTSTSTSTGLKHTRTAKSPERGGMGDWTNNRRRHFDRRREFKSRGKNSVTPGTSDEDGNGCRHPFGSCYPAKTKAQDIQRTEQAVRPRWKRREGPALERGCTSTFLFLG